MIACGLHIGAFTCQDHLKGGQKCIKERWSGGGGGGVMACAACYVALHHAFVLWCCVYLVMLYTKDCTCAYRSVCLCVCVCDSLKLFNPLCVSLLPLSSSPLQHTHTHTKNPTQTRTHTHVHTVTDG